ncbi:hypothetical protein DFO70_10872 [Cytobacillus firmus]|uniref:Uncharacterized protein n=2 Tax=Cytobacillus TaxID=2675230 RepID=A0A366JT19_CYTFI|nr:hypothetical protein DFO70_10872 [Cytobacillus firmus]TDX41493.1 hypothetical protein DFO72_10872 [Cytobacillus oceanisediminis]
MELTLWKGCLHLAPAPSPSGHKPNHSRNQDKERYVSDTSPDQRLLWKVSCVIRLMPVGLVQDVLASTFATGRGGF